MPSLPIPQLAEQTGITGNSRNAYAAMLKFVFGPRWDNWIHDSAEELPKLIAKKMGRMGGQATLHAVATSLPQSAGLFTGERYPLPHPTTGAYSNPRILARDCYTRLRQTGQVRRAARMGKKAAYAKPRRFEVEEAMKQSALNFVSNLYGGYAHIIGVVKSYAAGVCTLYGRNDRTSGSTTAINAYKQGAFRIRDNMIVAFVENADGILGDPNITNNSLANMLVTSAVSESDPDNPTVTVAGGVGDSGAALATILAGMDGGATINAPDDGDLLIHYASRQDTATGNTNNEEDARHFGPNGLDAFIKGTQFYNNLYGLSKTNVSKLSGIHLTNGEVNRAFTEQLLALLVQRVRTEGSGTKCNAVVVNDGMIREVVKENRGDREFAPIQRESGWDKRLSHTAGDIRTPYINDWLATEGAAFGLDTSQFYWCPESDQAPLEGGDRFVPDYDQNEIIFHKSGNEVCRKPHAQGMLDDLTRDEYALTA